MSDFPQLPLQLSVHGCKLAGARLQTLLEEAERPGAVPFEASLVEAAAPVLGATGRLQLLFADDVSMTEVDRGADHGISSFRDLLVAIHETLEDSPALPLVDEEARGRRAAAAALEASCFPEGTSYLIKPYRIQWSHVDSLKNALLRPENQAHLKLLHLEAEAARIVAWVELYSSKLRVTDLNPDFQQALAAAWEECLSAWNELYLEVRHYQKKHKADAEKIERAGRLLAPYEAQVEIERSNARKLRLAAKKRKQEQG